MLGFNPINYCTDYFADAKKKQKQKQKQKQTKNQKVFSCFLEHELIWNESSNIANSDCCEKPNNSKGTEISLIEISALGHEKRKFYVLRADGPSK